MMKEMPEKRLVSFRTLSAICDYRESWPPFPTECMRDNWNADGTRKRCNAKNCPVWRRARKKQPGIAQKEGKE